MVPQMDLKMILVIFYAPVVGSRVKGLEFVGRREWKEMEASVACRVWSFGIRAVGTE